MSKNAEDNFNSIMWGAFIRWAWTEQEICDAFKESTGLAAPAMRAPIEKLIDHATGHGDVLVERFVEWATVNVWGLEYAPLSYQQHLKEQAK